MRKIFVLVILFTIAGYTSMAQNGSDSKWSITNTPAIVAPKLKFGIQPGTQYRINERFALLTEMTIMISRDKDSSFSKMQYVRLKPELRYSFLQTSRWIGDYIGLQLSYSFRNWRDLNGGCFFQGAGNFDTTTSYDRAKVSSPVFTASLQSGRLFFIGEKFSVDVFYGMGVRVVHTDYSELVNVGAKQYYMRPTCKIIPVPDAAFWFEGNISRFHINAGLRFLYHF